MWLEKMEVGRKQHCTFMADIIGSSTAIEHLPKPDRSLITAIFFCLSRITPMLDIIPQTEKNGHMVYKISVFMEISLDFFGF